MNQQIIVGNVGDVPKLVYTSGGRAKATFSVASNESYTKNGQKVEKTSWFRVVCWGKVAESAQKFLTKGRQVFILGRTDNRSYEDGGVTKYISEVIADRVTFLGSKPTGAAVGAKTAETAEGKAPENTEDEGAEEPDTQEAADGDTPF